MSNGNNDGTGMIIATVCNPPDSDVQALRRKRAK